MRYPGGKGGCFRHIVNLMPPHDVYIETHLGGGNVLERKKPAAHSIGIDIDPAVIARWEQRDIEVSLLCMDAVEYLRDYRFTGRELVYSDPPYLVETRRSKRPLYNFSYTEAQHCELLGVLTALPCAVMLSGYRSGLYTEVLEGMQGWRCVEFESATRGGKAIECLWMNFVPGPLHDTSYVGDDFRERERIKRKRKRWRARLERMSPAERQAIIDEVRLLLAENGDRISSPSVAMTPAASPQMASPPGAAAQDVSC